MAVGERQRFTDPDCGFTLIAEFIRSRAALALTVQERWLYVCLADYMGNPPFEAKRAVSTIAKDAGLTKDNTRKLIRGLRDKGFLKVIPQKHATRENLSGVNIYVLLYPFPTLPQLINQPRGRHVKLDRTVKLDHTVKNNRGYGQNKPGGTVKIDWEVGSNLTPKETNNKETLLKKQSEDTSHTSVRHTHLLKSDGGFDQNKAWYEITELWPTIQLREEGNERYCEYIHDLATHEALFKWLTDNMESFLERWRYPRLPTCIYEFATIHDLECKPVRKRDFY